IVRTEFAKQYPQQLAQFLEEYAASTKWINENVEEGAALVEQYGIVKAAIAKKAIPLCNVTYIDGAEMKTALEGYLNSLFEQNPKAVGGKMPGNDFYYNAK
ncbi:MAG: ABC transporter substrate-binding protein, partial [Oscillospiraceae bacterium]|nr:ABC transporter substrate-binding protein [Oscillospiraceae bacterium]